MPRPAISVENLSKAYRIGLKEEIPNTLVGAMASFAQYPYRNLQRLRRLNTFSANGHDEDDIVWALKDVSFEVQKGEVVGIIGRNGAGKSTLLKVLSRITEPTSGRAVIRGRVSSLLEVGTGFHPELSGRENIYMNGTILGMKKREIDRKFDEIVDFSGVEKFLDTPIKRYSSGMKVRLAFSVAAHLEPEILIIDEVLAVGDAEFQKKCLGKMQDVAGEGRTVLFVSHNMAAVANLCSRAMLLDGGNAVADGDCEYIIGQYYNSSSGIDSPRDERFAHRVLNSHPQSDLEIQEASIRDETGSFLACDVPSESTLTIEIKYVVRRARPNVYICFCFSDSAGGDTWWQYDADTPVFTNRSEGTYVATVKVPSTFFRAGRYYFRANIVELGGNLIDSRGNLFYVTIGDTRSVLASKCIRWPTAVKYAAPWTTRCVAQPDGAGLSILEDAVNSSR